MRRILTTVLTAVIIVMVLISGSFLVQDQVQAENALDQRSSGAGVDVEVSFAEPTEQPPAELVFEINMDTHSGDLTGQDFIDKLRVSSGGTVIPASNYSWEWVSKSSHHPSAALTVINQDGSGEEVFKSGQDLELVISDLRDYEHEFSWNFSPDYFAVVANETDGTVSIVDYQEGREVGTIEIGETTGHGLAVSPDYRFLYAGDMAAGILKIYDTRQQEITAEVDIDAGIHGIDITPNGSYLFISPAGDEAGNLIVFDAENQEVVKRFGDELAGKSSHVALSPDNSLAVTALLAENMIQVISVASLEVIAEVEVGDGPNEARISPDGRFAYVANWESNELSVVDLNSFALITNIPAGEGTHGVAVAPDGREIWTANRRSNDVTVISAETREVVSTIASGEYANHLKFSPDGSQVLVTNARDNELIVINRAERSITTRMQVGNDPHEISFIQAD